MPDLIVSVAKQEDADELELLKEQPVQPERFCECGNRMFFLRYNVHPKRKKQRRNC